MSWLGECLVNSNLQNALKKSSFCFTSRPVNLNNAINSWKLICGLMSLKTELGKGSSMQLQMT